MARSRTTQRCARPRADAEGSPSAIGTMSAAANLARLTHAPDITLIYESGTLGTKPSVLPLSIGDGELCETALTTVSVPEMFRYWLMGGRITLGFLGGAQPGNPFGDTGMTLGFARGSIGGSGGSYGGLGGSANGAANPVYGVVQNPIDPGSGGRTISRTGGNGGGVIRISAQNLVLNGSIRADGATPIADSFAGGGSGGAIRIDVGTLSGSGQITARGGNGLPSSGGAGGGRIAIYYQNIDAFNLDNVVHFGAPGVRVPTAVRGHSTCKGPEEKAES